MSGIPPIPGMPPISHASHAWHSSHTWHSSHARHSSHAPAEASHIGHHVLEVAAASLCIGVVLVLPLAEVDLEPVLLCLLLKEPLPIGPLLDFLKSELDTPVANLVLGLLGVNFFQQLHVELVNLFVSCSGAFEVERVFLYLYFGILDIRNIDCNKDNFLSLGPDNARSGGHLALMK